jgi:hypothetical protein
MRKTVFRPEKIMKPDKSFFTAIVMIIMECTFFSAFEIIYFWPAGLVDSGGIREVLKIVFFQEMFPAIVWAKLSSDLVTSLLSGVTVIFFVIGMFLRYFNLAAILLWLAESLLIVLIDIQARILTVQLKHIGIEFVILALYVSTRIFMLEKKPKRTAAAESHVDAPESGKK